MSKPIKNHEKVKTQRQFPRQRMGWVLLFGMFCLFLGASPIFAENKSVVLVSLNLDDPKAMEFALLDYPKHYIPTLRAQLLEVHPQTDPVRWLRIIWFLSYLHEFSDADKMREAASLALQHRKYLEWADLRFSLIGLLEEDQPFEQVLDLYQEVINQARVNGDKVNIAYCLSKKAVFFLDHNHIKEAMDLIKEANDLTRESHSDSIHSLHAISDAFAMGLGSQGQWEAAFKIYSDLEATYKEQGIRAARALNLYNMAWYFMEDEKISPESLTFLNLALNLATEIEDLDTMASSLYGLSVYHKRTGRPDLAIGLARRALQYFTQLDDKLWMAYAATRLADALLETKQYAASLEYIDLAHRNFSEGNIEGQLNLEDFWYQAYKGLNQREKAFMHLERYQTAYKKFSAEKEKKEYNRAAVQMGLQFEEERNSALARQNDLQKAQIQLLKKFRVVSILAILLTLLILIVLFLVWNQASEIRRSRQEMKDVLHNIDEGLLIIDHNFQVMSGYSPYVEKILAPDGRDIRNRQVLDLFFLEKDRLTEKAVMIRETLRACVGEQVLSWELNCDHLPYELDIGERLFHVHWQALFDKQGIIRRFLIALRDITEHRRLEQAMALEKQRVSSMQGKLDEILGHDISAIHRLIHEMLGEFPRIHRVVFKEKSIKTAFRMLHSWKGVARSVGLRQLASIIHHVESGLNPFTDEIKVLAETEMHWQHLEAATQDYQQLLTHMLSQMQGTVARPKDLYGYASIYADEMSSRMLAAELPHSGVSVHDEVKDWPEASLTTIHEILLLGTSNAIDHGFILTQKKRQRKELALLQIHAWREQHSIQITLQDNGVGIDWDALKQRARDLAFEPVEEGGLTDLLFQDGISTADHATETSGRGVGLSAIKALSEKLGGRVSLSAVESGGTILRMTIPDH